MNQLHLFTDLKSGDKVKHKLTGGIMTVKKINQTVATCNTGEFYPVGLKESDIAVCLVENLEKI